MNDYRHNIMSSIKSKGTKPEIIVRHWLWKKGFRFRINYKRLPGHPDIVLRKYRTCIFVNGCFWHGHGVDVENNHIVSRRALSCFRMPNSNLEYWENKIVCNRKRDKEVQRKLAEMGWHCITVWECELSPKAREQTLESLAFTLNHIWMKDHQVVAKPYPLFDEEEGMLKAAEKL